MKPLTAAQQAIVDVMRTGVILRKSRIYGWFEYVEHHGHVMTNTAKSLVRNGVIIEHTQSHNAIYYKLSPEYLNA